MIWWPSWVFAIWTNENFSPILNHCDAKNTFQSQLYNCFNSTFKCFWSALHVIFRAARIRTQRYLSYSDIMIWHKYIHKNIDIINALATLSFVSVSETKDPSYEAYWATWLGSQKYICRKKKKNHYKNVKRKEKNIYLRDKRSVIRGILGHMVRVTKIYIKKEIRQQ